MPHLRLALLLLDNAAEIQMDGRIQSNWKRDVIKERLRELSLEVPPEHLTEYLRELTQWTPLTRSEKYKIEKFFDEKIAYLVGCGDLEESLASPLKYLHRYRNEAYHRAKVRSETIRTALILLEINCRLALNMHPEMYSSGEDYSWSQTRFGYKPQEVFFSRDDKLANIIDDIRSPVLPSDSFVSDTLASHLQNRFAELQDDLGFIVEDGGRANKELALCESQFYTELERAGTPYAPDALKGFTPKYTLRSITDLEAQLTQVPTAVTRVEAFHWFSDIEKQLEPIEDCVSNLVSAIDRAIQAEIDRIRGK